MEPECSADQHENDEWEDVLLASYVPIMTDLDEMPKGRKLIKLLDSVCFEHIEIPHQFIDSHTKIWASSRSEIRFSPRQAIRKMQTILRRDKEFVTSNIEDQLHELVGNSSGLNLHLSHGGKFLIVVENSFQASNIVIARVDLADNTLHKLVDVPPDQVIVPGKSSDTFRQFLANTCYVSNKYAYFAAKDIVFRINVWTGEINLVFQVGRDGWNQPNECLSECKFTPLSDKLLVVMTIPRHFGCESRKLRIIQVSDCNVVHEVQSSLYDRGRSTFYSQFAVLKEGVISKGNSGSSGAKCRRYQNVYRLYSLSDLRLLTKHEVDNSCQYSRDWFSINYFRIWGFPVFIESVFIDKKNSYHFSLSILYKNRFHQLTTPCPIDMRYKKIASVVNVTQPDPKLTELVVEVTGLKRWSTKEMYLLRLKI